ncbi:MAG: glutamine--fructose-6-phosphate transaminase (isomerizing) [bacterium]|nr:glutamine--fructose-6-phosphate transaminase (isomerizing) [bacterium]
MCGIFGYAGNKEIKKIIIESLKRLEYRGYDSSGIAFNSNGVIIRKRTQGKVQELEKLIKTDQINSKIGIGHIRWATHGAPSEENAHPHTDENETVCVVHNGIIENYNEIKKNLNSKFSSQTDTEVIAHLIAKSKGLTALEKIYLAFSKLKGSWACAIIFKDEPEKVYFSKNEAPLIIGIGENENFLASDIPAILPYTRKIIVLEDREYGFITKDTYEIYKDGEKIEKSITTIDWDITKAEKGGYKHFMLKEIFEQPQVIIDTLRGRTSIMELEDNLNAIGITKDEIMNFESAYITACGTSYHAGMIGKYIIEELVGSSVNIDIASEFRYRNFTPNKNSILIAISQSGETADTIAAVRKAKSLGMKTLGVINVIGSTIARECHYKIYTRCGPEIGVASTKAFTGQVIVLYLIALYAALIRKNLTVDQFDFYINELLKLPHLVNEVLNSSKKIRELAKKFVKKTSFLYLARHLNYPIALEGALKLKEISYIHAEGYAAGEMKHGPIALIDEDMPVFIVATNSRVIDKIISNIEEVKARGGITIVLTDVKEKLEKLSDYIIQVPSTIEFFQPIVNIIPMQLFAYYIADFKGNDVDQPRNLAKSVTVE